MRRLNADEQVLWDRVVDSVTPLHPRAATPQPSLSPPQPLATTPQPRKTPPRPRETSRHPAPAPGSTLDGSWDRRLARGLVQPDLTVDLHGHNLATAYALLDDRLDSAIVSGARLLLLITGKPPAENRQAGRGAIRAAVGDWLAASRHSARIAAVRNAHQRHGGSGALYIVLRRNR